jgi:transcriptional regulator with XRE-family HTH domain
VTVFQRPPMPWGEALRRERQKHPAKYSPRQLAERCGVSEGTVLAWERGELAPTGRELPRLYASLRAMTSYGLELASLRLRLGAKPVEPVPAFEPPTLAPEGAPQPPTPPTPSAEAKQEWRSFGQALASLRVENGLYQHEVSELVGHGTLQAHVSCWEQDKNAPTEAQLAELISLLPELGAAPAPLPDLRPCGANRSAPRSTRSDVVAKAPEKPKAPEPTKEATAAPASPPPPAEAPAKAPSAEAFRRWLALARDVRKRPGRAGIVGMLRTMLDAPTDDLDAVHELAKLAAELGLTADEVIAELE